MLNKEKHQLIMGRILKDLYSDTSIAPLLGFKGGTCAYLFYGLPRFSVDLDFDLIGNGDGVFEKVSKIIKEYGEIKDQYVKRYTIFFLLSYGDNDHNIKIEINTREPVSGTGDFYELKKHLGISMLVAKREYLFSGKLVALTARKDTAMRDIYDIYYFLKNNWEIDRDLIKARTGKGLNNYLMDCVEAIEKVKDNQILQGLGELLSEKEKAWVRAHLREEAVFMLKNYAVAVG